MTTVTHSSADTARPLRGTRRSARVSYFLILAFYAAVALTFVICVFTHMAWANGASSSASTETPLAVDPAKYSAQELRILETMGHDLDGLQSLDAWTQFVAAHKEELPPLGDKLPQHIAVQKKEITIAGETFTLGLGYREILLKAPLQRVAGILRNTPLYQALYGLSGPAGTPEADLAAPVFEARIFKKVPILSDQDYVLRYQTKEEANLRFIRAKMKEDRNNFALRDNLTVLESTDAGVILREISYVYILKWYLRALGPQVRSVMNTELAKINAALKCFAENGEVASATYDVAKDAATACWKKAEKQ